MSKVADRYANALYEVCAAKGSAAAVLDSLVVLADCLVTNPDIYAALTSPLISPDDKLKIIEASLSGQLTPEISGFFKIIAKNNRFGSIPSIVTAFRTQVEKSAGLVSGEVKSATELTDQEKAQLQKVIEDKLSRKVQLSFKTDKDMIGGLEAKVGSYIFEDSVKAHMQKLNDYITRRVQ